MYIQPCCINKELPELLRKEGHCFFQLNGDCTVTEVMSAVSFMVEGGTAILALPDISVFLLRTLRAWLAKGWFRSLILLTGERKHRLVSDVFTQEEGKPGKVFYASSTRIQDSLFALTNGSRFLVIQGPLIEEKDFSLCQYAAYLGNSCIPFVAATEAITACVKTSAYIRSDDELANNVLQKKYEP